MYFIYLTAVVDVQFSSQLGHDLHVTFAPDMVMTDHNKPILYGRTRHNIFLCFEEKEVKNSIGATIQLRGSRGLETMEISSCESPVSMMLSGWKKLLDFLHRCNMKNIGHLHRRYWCESSVSSFMVPATKLSSTTGNAT